MLFFFLGFLSCNVSKSSHNFLIFQIKHFFSLTDSDFEIQFPVLIFDNKIAESLAKTTA